MFVWDSLVGIGTHSRWKVAPGWPQSGAEMLKKQAENSGQWAASRHRRVLSIYTFNYSFTFQHFSLEHSASWYFKVLHTAPSSPCPLDVRLRLRTELNRRSRSRTITQPLQKHRQLGWGAALDISSRQKQEPQFILRLASYQRNRGLSSRLESNHWIFSFFSSSGKF